MAASHTEFGGPGPPPKSKRQKFHKGDPYDFDHKVTRVMRVEAPRQFLPNVRSSGLALAKGMNSEQIWPGTRNFAKLKLLMFHVRVFLLDAHKNVSIVSIRAVLGKLLAKQIALVLK